MQVYRWDLDKTYLLTNFHSVRDLVKAALETARDKQAVPGAPALLRELGRERPGWRPHIFILSGSPTQMREVLERKLLLDGVRYDTFILKDNMANLKRGRLRAVRGQFGYKLPRLLEGRVGLGPAVRESLFGDDAESDALIYTVYADALAGRVSAVELSRVMEAAGAYPDQVVEALAAWRKLAQTSAVDHIFIRLDRGLPPARFHPLGPRVVPVYSWFQAALVLGCSGELDAVGVDRVLATAGLDEEQAVYALTDIIERGHAPLERLEPLMSALQGRSALADVLATRFHAASFQVSRVEDPGHIDHLAVLRSWEK